MADIEAMARLSDSGGEEAGTARAWLALSGFAMVALPAAALGGLAESLPFLAAVVCTAGVGAIVSAVAGRELMPVRLTLAGGVIALATAGASAGIEAFLPYALDVEPQTIASALLAWLAAASCFCLGWRATPILIAAMGISEFACVATSVLTVAVPGMFVIFLLSVGVGFWHGYSERAARGGRVALAHALRQVAAATVLAVPIAWGLAWATLPVAPGVAAMPGATRAITWSSVTVGTYLFFRNRLVVGGFRGVPSNRPLYRIRSPEPALWRVATYEYYDGRSWFAGDLQALPARWAAGGWLVRDVPPGPGPARRLEYTVAAVSLDALVMPVAARPVAVRLNIPTWTRPLAVFLSDDTVRARQTLMAGAWYEAVSLVPSPTPAQLRAAEGQVPEKVARLADQVTAMAQAELGPIVRQVTAGCTNDYDRALRIMQYLRGRCAYNIAAPAPPPGEDAAVWFVKRVREGACDSFATAMAVMCRLAGIPARIVSGFAPGEEEGRAGEFVVRERDAHAWVELYFPGYGWIEFDPSPVRGVGSESFWQVLRRGLFSVAALRTVRQVGWFLVALAIALLGAAGLGVLQGVGQGLKWLLVGDPIMRVAGSVDALRHRLATMAGCNALALCPGELAGMLLQYGARRAVAERLRRAMEEFSAARYGPGVDRRQARQIARRVRAAVAAAMAELKCRGRGHARRRR